MSNLAYKSEREDYEIINGKVYMMARPGIRHDRIQGNIRRAFDNYLKGKTCQAFGEVDVFLSDDDNFIPDAMIVCNPDIVEEKGIYGVPDLVVEILSKSTAVKDKMDKFIAYEKYGVKEYWIVDPFIKSVEVYHLVDGRFVRNNVYQLYTEEEFNDLTDEQKSLAKSDIKVSLYDDFYVNINDVFERVK
ncbi:MAG: Uma2 family endonuclease [Selenomonadaceae bacterium]|nr:Uma2 family endonuclease [Selenomonadaceae bacterium]